MTECAYCPNTATTNDHVPPRCFFPKPRTSDLITVPCCNGCNSKFSKNDEYVKTIIAMRNDIGRHPEGRKLVDSIVRAIGRSKGKGFSAQLFDSIENIDLRTPGGLFLGFVDIHMIDKDRFHGFVERLARGLFYHVFKQRVPCNFQVAPAPFLEVNLNTWRKFAEIIAAENVRETGRGVFRYGWSEAENSPLSSCWYMEFFGMVPFGAIVRDTAPPPSADN